MAKSPPIAHRSQKPAIWVILQMAGLTSNEAEDTNFAGLARSCTAPKVPESFDLLSKSSGRGVRRQNRPVRMQQRLKAAP